MKHPNSPIEEEDPNNNNNIIRAKQSSELAEENNSGLEVLLEEFSKVLAASRNDIDHDLNHHHDDYVDKGDVGIQSLTKTKRTSSRLHVETGKSSSLLLLGHSLSRIYIRKEWGTLCIHPGMDVRCSQTKKKKRITHFTFFCFLSGSFVCFISDWP